MIRAKPATAKEATERKAIGRRVKQMYDSFNRELWDKCFSFVDPAIRGLDPSVYAKSLQAFKSVYESINLWQIRISLHLDARSNKHDDRPFAYVYVVWQDAAHGFHMFRERWVKDSNHWYTRVVGLVPNERKSVRNQD